MTDLRSSLIRAHRNNISRFCKLLATNLSHEDRQYIQKRMTNDRAELERLEMEAESLPHSADDAVGNWFSEGANRTR
jgi:hypothetical protein